MFIIVQNLWSLKFYTYKLWMTYHKCIITCNVTHDMRFFCGENITTFGLWPNWKASKQNRGSTEGYSRWKVTKRHGKFGKTGLYNLSISKSQKWGSTELGVNLSQSTLPISHDNLLRRVNRSHRTQQLPSLYKKLARRDQRYAKTFQMSKQHLCDNYDFNTVFELSIHSAFLLYWKQPMFWLIKKLIKVLRKCILLTRVLYSLSPFNKYRVFFVLDVGWLVHDIGWFCTLYKGKLHKYLQGLSKMIEICNI